MKRSGKLMRILVRPRLARALLRHGVAASVEHIAALRVAMQSSGGYRRQPRAVLIAGAGAVP